MIRRKAFIEAGGFWDAFYHEEDELSIRMLLRGGRIRYVPCIRVVHLSAFAGEGNMEARWQLMFSQTTRMQWKYWPRLVAWYRSQVVALGMVMSAVFHRFPLRTIVNGWRQARATAYKAWTQEHINVSYAEMRRITMRRSIWHHMFHYYWLRLKRRTRNA
jgi:GT2 family glycosyltransferase